jgi:hypothetical protein
MPPRNSGLMLSSPIGPIVAPFILIKRPLLVVHTSPFVGEDGIFPCGILTDAPALADVGKITVPVKVGEPANTKDPDPVSSEML